MTFQDCWTKLRERQGIMPRGEKPFDGLSVGARSDLLRVLQSSARVRADVIRQFYERGANQMVEVLSELEGDELLRLRVVEALIRSL